jgi:hypothetical protein
MAHETASEFQAEKVVAQPWYLMASVSIVLCSDLIVLPYEPNRYRRSGSGVATEGISEGTPMVVPYGRPPLDAPVSRLPGDLRCWVAGLSRIRQRASSCGWRQIADRAMVLTLLYVGRREGLGHERTRPARNAGYEPGRAGEMDANLIRSS